MNTYTASAGDSWDTIAFRAYKNPWVTPRLLAANSQYSQILLFEGGEIVKLPNITVAPPVVNPPWRQ